MRQADTIPTIVRSYDDWIVRLYCSIRFRIIHMRILEQLEQYIPPAGTTLDLGCGFGLFSLYFATCGDDRMLVSYDRDPRRIELARTAAARLGLTDRTQFEPRDVLDVALDRAFDAIIMLDLLHHLPERDVVPILQRAVASLPPGGILLIKDVDTTPWLKLAFTWCLDKAMYPSAPVRYYHRDEMRQLLEELGLDVKVHQLVDLLPYPHVLYVARKL